MDRPTSNMLQIQEFPLFLNGNSKPMFCKDSSGRIISANRQALMYFGIKESDPDWFVGKTEADIIKHTNNLESLIDKANYTDSATWESRRPCGFIQDAFPIPSNKIRKKHNVSPVVGQVELLKFPTYDDAGNRLHMLTIIFDLTAESTCPISSISNSFDSLIEVERKRVANEVHDVIGNSITALKLSLNMINHYVESDNTEAAMVNIKTALSVCDEAADDVRKISTGLRPGVLDEYGVLEALEWITWDFNQKFKENNHKAHVSYHSSLSEQDKFNVSENLSDAASTVMFRVAQESICLAIKYANRAALELKDKLEITLSVSMVNNKLQMLIRDNGLVNMPSNELKSGILYMRDRVKIIGGKIRIRHADGMFVVFSINLAPFEAVGDET